MKNWIACMCLCLTVGVCHGMGRSASRPVRVLLVPSTPGLVQFGFDMAEHGQMFLMTYAASEPPESPFLNLWDGSQWIRIPAERFAAGAFLKNRSETLVVVGPENEKTASLLQKGLAWNEEVLLLDTLSVTELLNHFGRMFSFSRADWHWYAQRYGLELEDLTPREARQSWYDQERASALPPGDRPWRARGDTPPPADFDVSLTPMELPPESEPEEGEPIPPAESVDLPYRLEVED